MSQANSSNWITLEQAMLDLGHQQVSLLKIDIEVRDSCH
jgi:hypothetical protein